MPDDFTHDSANLQWEPLTSDDQPGREWTPRSPGTKQEHPAALKRF